MTLDELKDYLKKSGIKHFNVVTNLVGPDDEWTEAEQEEDCCQLVPDHDPCVEVGKTEPWNGWTEEEKQELGWYPKPGQTTPEELLANAEQTYGKGNVHLKIRETGPRPCGEKITRWRGSLSCCTSPTELVKFSGATTAAPDDTETYKVLGGTGEPPITWHTIGAGVTVAKTDATSARANFDNCFCKPVVIYAQDTCLSVAPWVVSRSDGSWASIDDESLSSPFGWYQDGTTGTFYITGFNDDNTKVSTQHYWQAEYGGTKEVVCGTTMPGINENPIVTPADGSQAFEKCESANIWVRLREGFSNVWEVRYAIDSQSTSEYTPGTCEDELLYDSTNSVKTIADDSTGWILWEGGIGPFDVQVGGQGIWVDSAKTSIITTTTSRQQQVWTGDACGELQVTVTDSCGSSVYGRIHSTSGSWRGECYAHYGWLPGSYSYDNNYVHGQQSMGYDTDYPCQLWPYADDYPNNTGWVVPFSYSTHSASVYRWVASGPAWGIHDYAYTAGHQRKDTHEQYLAQLAAWGISPNTLPASYAPNGPIDMINTGMSPCGSDCVWEC